MSIFNRFFGRREADDGPDDLVAADHGDDQPSFQVLFREKYRPSAAAIVEAMRAYHPDMEGARCEFAEELSEDGKLFGLAGWGDHVIRMVGFDLPIPAEVAERCIAPAHYPQELKQQARAHKSHLILWYAGHDESVLEQFVALAAFAGVLERFGAIVVLNESAHTSFPAAALSGKDASSDIMDVLREGFPLPILFCGLVKYNVPDSTQVWMRTYGAHVMGLPDLAAYTAGHHEGQRYLDTFNNILRYLLDSGRTLAPGHTLQTGPDEYLRCRAPREDEEWLESEGEVLLVELIGADEINR